MHVTRFRTGSLIICLMATTGSGAAVAAETSLRVPVYATARPPLVEIQAGEVRGILPEMFKAILEHAGLSFVFDPVPVMRKRVLFEDGVYVLACCANPAWRNRPKERDVQLFSEAFTQNRDIFVFPKGKSFPVGGRADLGRAVVGVRRGFDYRGSRFFGTRLDLESEDAIFKALLAGRVDVGIVNEHTFHASPHHKNLDEGPEHDVVSLHIRVHKNRSDLLPRINGAIAAFMADGTHDLIVRKYHMMGL